jgi:putative transposase
VFWRWRNAGVSQKIHDALCRLVRHIKSKKPTPATGILDSPSPDTTDVGGVERGDDATKNVNGRKRHIMVDTLGWIMAMVVHTANIQDYDSAKRVFQVLSDGFQRVKGFVVQPKRGIVKRTFAGIGKYRRYSKDDERNPASSKAVIHIVMINRRLNHLQQRKIHL